MKNISVIIILFINAIYSQDTCNYSTDGILTDINEEIYNNDESVNAYLAPYLNKYISPLIKNLGIQQEQGLFGITSRIRKI